jgi:hypothetical protein
LEAVIETEVKEENLVLVKGISIYSSSISDEVTISIMNKYVKVKKDKFLEAIGFVLN